MKKNRSVQCLLRCLRSFLRLLFPAAAAAICLFLCEYTARGTWSAEIWNSFVVKHWESYGLAFLFLWFAYGIADALFHLAPLSVLLTGLLACVPAAVNYYTLRLRGEPFLPWDLSQVGEAAGVASAAGIKLQTSMILSAAAVLVLAVVASFLYRGRKRRAPLFCIVQIAATSAAMLVLIFGVYLSPSATLSLGIVPDAWMQDRYYRWYGMISGFMTNLQNLEIKKPEGYSEEAVEQLAAETEKATIKTLFRGSYGTQAEAPEQMPTIIYVMNESYWDVSELEGVELDTDVSVNLHRLQQSSASGRIYSPSFGGGTCDVEFEALTGYSVSHLPTGAKPYQQHVTHTMFSLPNYLKALGYRTEAIHCYYAKYWSRSTAYPYLGFDRFISLENMLGADKVRSYYWKNGLVTDAYMAQQVIGRYEALKAQSDAPVFLHTVTMQNHTNYNAANYADEDRVHVLSAPAGMSGATIGALEDFATGVRDADAMLGTLTDYFSNVDEPVILVFWGDHYNPINSGYDVYTSTGYAPADTTDPALHETNLLVWSNYSDTPIDLGVVAAYEISPVMMELYGIEEPLYFKYLLRQFAYGYRSRSAGVTVSTNGTASEELTEAQQAWYEKQWLLQYDLMFGNEYALQSAEGQQKTAEAE